MTCPARIAALGLLILCAAVAKTSAAGTWTRHDEPDPIDRTVMVTVVLPAREGMIGMLGKGQIPRKPILVLRCRQHQIQVIVLYDVPVTGPNETVKALYQGQGSPMVAGLFETSPDQTSFGAYSTEKSRPILDVMAASNDLTIRTKSDTGQTTESAFDLSGLAEAAAPVRSACGLQARARRVTHPAA